MTQPAIALYLGESYATARLFDAAAALNKSDKSAETSAMLFEKSVYLTQVSLKNILNQIKVAAKENEIKTLYVVTSYMDRLKSFRLGGSVVQVVPEGFENSYAVGNTQYLSLAAPSLIVSVNETSDAAFFKKELARLRKINSEVNKVVLQLPENLISKQKKQEITDLFVQENFKIFDCEQANDLDNIRRTLLNAGSEGTKEEIISDIKETFGEDASIQFWVKDRFQKEFENIDLYWSSSYFLKNYLTQKKTNSAFYFDFERWTFISAAMATVWLSPWGAISYEHPVFENFEIDPFSALISDSIGQLVVSEASPQHEPGPIIAGRSVKALILDCFYDEIKSKPTAKELFPQLSLTPLHQKLETHFQVLEKSQTLEATLFTREGLKNWIRSKLLTWIQLKPQETIPTVFGNLCYLLKSSNSASPTTKLNTFTFKWADAIIAAVEKQGNL
ncbi:MAG: hypothetical protein WA160_06105 [Pseudobdellovibrio sp.]